MEILDDKLKQNLAVPKFYTCPGRAINDKNLSPNSKLLYMIIFHLCSKQDCFATNEYFSILLNIGERQVQNCLKELKEHNYINIRNDKKARYISALVTFEIISPRSKNTPISELAQDYIDNRGFEEL